MEYRRCGDSGVQLPMVSLGMWHNFGGVDDYARSRDMILRAFELGICHLDLANNYGPPPGSAELTFGKVMKEELASHRDELFISSKAGHEMWPGVYGGNSSRKNLIASCDASLKRTGLEYFDVFYNHRYDGVTPVEETMQALIDIVRSGKALYVGISKYPLEQQKMAYSILREAKVPCLVSQYRYSILDRKAERENFELVKEAGSGLTVFSPLAQGLLTNRYLNGIPEGSRASKAGTFLKAEQVTPEKVEVARRLDAIARQRGQTLAEMALSWVLSDSRVTSVIVGASSVAQLEDSVKCLDNLSFTADELMFIEEISESVALK